MGQSDVFSLGVMFFQLLTGRLPFKGESIANLMFIIASEPHPDPMLFNSKIHDCAVSVIPDPFGSILKFANAAAVGIAGAINVKKILSTKPVTTSAPSIGGGGSGGAPAPSFNVVAGTGSNQIAQSLANQDTPIKAFVVSSDVSTSQSRDRNIVQNASL